MRTVQASEAKTHLPQLLDDVERGATLIITRHGRPIARLVPEPVERQAEVEESVRRIQARRQRNQHVTVEEILSWRDEGRR
ncbi:MAG TPA: type II toxin-antitoxin system Phd/YefM family antitoxin [Silvibacterium sp.]|nr:type II toxin-antitoxin system Phd/YefM family antitoxin [Silvibacterium sp.]